MEVPPEGPPSSSLRPVRQKSFEQQYFFLSLDVEDRQWKEVPLRVLWVIFFPGTDKHQFQTEHFLHVL